VPQSSFGGGNATLKPMTHLKVYCKCHLHKLLAQCCMTHLKVKTLKLQVESGVASLASRCFECRFNL